MLSRGRWQPHLLLAALVLLALLPRLAAVRYNVWAHGDVLLDAAVVDSLVQQRELKVPIVDVRYYPTGRFGFGYPPDQHPPLWPLLGAIVRVVWPNSYEALKLLSLLAGLLLVPAVYRLGRDLFGQGPGLLAASLCASSYLLIDFSGNGALWTFLALLYVLFVWRTACFPLGDTRNAIAIGLIMGLAYLTNYPAVVLPLTYAALLLLLWLQPNATHPASRETETSPSQEALAPALSLSLSKDLSLILSLSKDPPLLRSLLPFGVAALVALPWLLYSLATFGSPIWSQPLERQLGGGDKQIAVVIENGEAVKRNLPSADPLGERIRVTAQNLYGNAGFLARQSFVLLPFLGGFVLAGLGVLSLRAARGMAGRTLPLLLLTLIHGALIVLWPTTKFRYLVPLLPLAILIGSWLLWLVKPAELRNLLAGLALALAAFTSLWTWTSIPSHTYYYDGGIVTDNFGAQGETAYIAELRRLEQAAAAIRAAGNSDSVLGPHALYALLPNPLVVESSAYGREMVEHLVKRYGIRFVVADPARIAAFAAFLPGRVIWQGEGFGVFQIE